MRGEGVFVLRLSEHLSPILTGPKFFPALGDGDEEVECVSEDLCAIRKEASPVLVSGTAQRAKVFKTPYATCARPRQQDRSSRRPSGQKSQRALSSAEPTQQAEEPSSTGAVLQGSLKSRLRVPATWARVSSTAEVHSTTWSQEDMASPGTLSDVPDSDSTSGG